MYSKICYDNVRRIRVRFVPSDAAGMAEYWEINIEDGIYNKAEFDLTPDAYSELKKEMALAEEIANS